MMNLHEIFAPQVGAMLENFHQQSRKEAASIPLYGFSIAFHAAIAAGVMLFEFELLYRVFSYLAGDDSEYWTPEVMGLSSFILVVAIHFQVERNANNVVVRLINKLAGVSAVTYALGIASLLSMLVYLDGADLFEVEADDIDAPTPWIMEIVTGVAGPFASVMFSLGIGALVIINLFVAHHAMHKVKTASQEMTSRREAYAADKQDLEDYLDAKRQFRALAQQDQDEMLIDRDTLCHEVANDALMVIHEALIPSLSAINNAMMLDEVCDVLPKSQLNIEQIQKAVKPIQAITADTLIKAMK